jgi:hypothetical protein
MTDRILRDPMTLDEERRAALNLHEQSDHVHTVRNFIPKPLIERDNGMTSTSDLFKSGMVAAILSGDCENER